MAEEKTQGKGLVFDHASGQGFHHRGCNSRLFGGIEKGLQRFLLNDIEGMNTIRLFAENVAELIKKIS